MPAARLLSALLLVTLLLPASLLLPWVAPPLALAMDGLLLVGFFVDRRRARRAALSAERRWPPLLMQGADDELEVEIRSHSPRRLRIRLREGLAPALAAAPARHEVRLAPSGTATWTIGLRPRRRGEHEVGPLTARLLGPWGLAWHQRELLAPEPRRVFPRVRWEGRVGQLLTLAHRRRLGSMPQRLHGVGTEPYALRAYLPGDPLGRIHWKATARHGKLVSREDTWERGARLVVLLDCARSMAAPAEPAAEGAEGEEPPAAARTESKLDAALAAALALARVAAARGDRVTLLAFSDRVERRVAVGSGRRSLAAAYSELYDLPARLCEPAFDLAAEEAYGLGGRSATAVLLTSVVDLAAAELLRESVLRLERRHRVLLINLEDAELARMVRGAPATAAEAFAQVSAMEIVLANQRLARRLRGAGVRVVGTPADRLALSTLEAYLAIFRGSGARELSAVG